MKKVKYTLHNLCCANCAAKMEDKINKLPGVQEANIVYVNKTLYLTAENPESYLPQIQEICSKIESHVVVEFAGEARSHADHVHDHSHEHHDHCGCGHDHGHEHHDHCNCGHDHSHEHHDHCDCGHDHGHEHHDHCGCGHDHGHEHHDHGHVHSHIAAGDKPMKDAKAEYLMKNLCCANCAAKMEAKIKELPGIKDASIAFTTKTLYINADNPESYLEQIRAICASIESQVEVLPKVQRGAKQEEDAHDQKRELAEIIVGAVLMLSGVVLSKFSLGIPAIICFVIAYIVLGYEVIGQALNNLKNGHLFDENFLMSIATIGAFIISDYAEAVGVMLFFRIGEYFEHRAVESSRKAIMEAIDMRPEKVHKIIDDMMVTIPAENAKVGDILQVRPGDRVPLDGTVVSGSGYLDTSAITGESVPVFVAEGDPITSGYVNQNALLTMKVDRALGDSMVSRILDAVENAAASKPKMDRFITRFARIYTPIVVAIAVLTAVLPSIITGDWYYWVHTAITFLVISCPCALVLSVPLAYFAGIGAGGKEGILFKGGASIEVLQKVDVVAMDKTGTLTRGDFAVSAINVLQGDDENELLAIAAACEENSTHPIALSIAKAAKQRGIGKYLLSDMEEISGHGIAATLQNGAKVYCGNKKLMEKFGIACDMEMDTVYGSVVAVAKDGAILGYIEVSDKLKNDAVSAVAHMKQQGVKTAMLTGDKDENAAVVAKELGIDIVRSQLLPEDKLSVVQGLRNEHGKVMFVGDGINDALVLAGADVGAAMGSGADAAIEAADVVFMNNGVEAINRAIAIAKKAGSAAMQNVVFALVIKAMVMVLGFFGHANMWFAVFADSGVAMLCVLNSIRTLYTKK